MPLAEPVGLVGVVFKGGANPLAGCGDVIRVVPKLRVLAALDVQELDVRIEVGTHIRKMAATVKKTQPPSRYCEAKRYL